MTLPQTRSHYGLVVLVGLLCAAAAQANQSLKGLTLADAIDLLEQQGLSVFYSSDTIKPWMQVATEPESGRPRRRLTALLAPFDLKLRNGPKNTLLIVPVEQPAQPTNRGTILGVVRAPGQGPLIANVEVSLVGNSNRQLIADDGRFSFASVKPGQYTLHVRHPTYRWEGSEEVTVRANKPAVALIELGAPAVARLDRVVVGASQYELLRPPGSSHRLLTNTMLEHFPDVGDDPLRAVKRLPGVATGGLSAASNVRGGVIDETLIRFDGLRLVNPFHLRDFQSIFSTIDPRIVRTIDVYTGGFPVNYGDRMSGVIDVESMSPPAPRYHEVGLSFFNTSILSSGIFSDGDGEWLASARRSNLDLWFDALNNLPGKPRYTDAFAKISHELGSATKITGNVLLFSDDLQLSDTDIEEVATAKYQDRYLWLRLDHRLGDKLTSATLLANTKLESTRQGTVDKPGDSIGSVFDDRDFNITSLQSDWRWAANDNLLVSFGAEWKNLRGDYTYADQARYEILFDTPGASTTTL
ncbi:MAG: TonB-dependent receptor, partial [Gammaproteobacteria bacterium]|nr:TonB-dependent receptor [Gammaproteobacteria bacterium]